MQQERAHRLHRPGIGLLAGLEVFGLGALAALLVLWAIPQAFDIEWSCLSSEGLVRRMGDSYGAGVALAGTFGWLLVGVGTLFAIIAESRRTAALLPVAWFLVFVVGAILAAAAMSPQLCPSG
ncbi:MAG TPA: hypothetical protein VI503_00090 [Gaiellaceae bacterium]|nr:hypothetical protein [Gaiellaceae bacterium]